VWALVQNNQIVKIYSRAQAVTIDGIQHPGTIFSAWTEQARNAIGIYRIVRGTQKDSFYYTNGNPTYTFADGVVTESFNSTAKSLSDVNATDGDGNAVLDPDGNQVVIPGLKTLTKQQIKTTAAGLLQSTDWMVVRAAEGSTAVPEAVATYRAAVRTTSNSMETAIDNAASVDALIALSTNTEAEDGSIVLGTLNDWPEAPEV
jgi:hypothetical protein